MSFDTQSITDLLPLLTYTKPRSKCVNNFRFLMFGISFHNIGTISDNLSQMQS